MTFSCGLEGIYLYQPPALRVPRCTPHAVVSQSLHLFHTRARLPVSHGEALTIHLLLSDGQDRVLSLPPATTPQTLRHHLLAQGLVASHQADGKPIALLLLDLSLPSLGLRTPGEKTKTWRAALHERCGGMGGKTRLATLTGLQEGDTILLPPSSSPSSPPSSSSSSFVPYPEICSPLPAILIILSLSLSRLSARTPLSWPGSLSIPPP
ncbi:hypothetical protein NGA_0717500 [Nannochloropsis gaditana CCMP526]|uniref:uncharacterized protein n=1 Tax=Nannochloropsis gaditana (strain CCMP526) TaxID=1093141 RepID=UPI00029F796A|nr:hypothetical protein NGA_0717500 [Nannochloropsis gaditana CCMP526]EKU23180.1 hypothetical protein NGA_0717500 [Nannochloropsis gaditana CCMP526]|eukprot:XP_005852653.1 hypothetical protein NGA_0717500 [Nannochloropsis gaditana CCMP526]